MAETREALRQQGFKTDLSEFDFSTSSELRAREAVLKATEPARNTQPFLDHPDLMEPAENNMVVVVWKQSSLKRRSPSWPDNSEVLAWDEFRQVVNQKQPQIDAACTAILAGPIQFNLDAAGGSYMLLPHLALLKNLTQRLDGRVLLALHDGNLAEPWTNLLAATRLVTAWRGGTGPDFPPGPVRQCQTGVRRHLAGAPNQLLDRRPTRPPSAGMGVRRLSGRPA